MKYRSKNSIINNFTNCMVPAKQSKITHIEMSLKKSYIPLLVTVEFNGNTSQWFSEISKMMYNWSPKQNI